MTAQPVDVPVRPALVVTSPSNTGYATADRLRRFGRLRAVGFTIAAAVTLADSGYDVVGFAAVDGAR